MKKVAILVVVIMMAITHAAFAGTEAGDKEIQVQGTVSNTTNSVNDDSTSTSTIQVSFNYFFSPNISIGGTYRGTGSKDEPESGDSSISTQTFLLARGDLYLGSATSQVMPYIGGQIGQISWTDERGDEEYSDSVGTYGFHGGIKIFAGENVSWNLELDRTIYEYEPDFGETIELIVDSFFAGFSYYF